MVLVNNLPDLEVDDGLNKDACYQRTELDIVKADDEDIILTVVPKHSEVRVETNAVKLERWQASLQIVNS